MHLNEPDRDRDTYRPCDECEVAGSDVLTPHNGRLLCERCLYEQTDVQADFQHDERRKVVNE